MNKEKRIMVTGFFMQDKRILHGKEAYFKRLMQYMSKHYGFIFDVKNVSRFACRSLYYYIILGRPQISLPLPPGSIHSYLEGHTGYYLGLPNFESIFMKKERTVCFDIAKRQSLYNSRKISLKFASRIKLFLFFLSAGVALKRLSSNLLNLRPSLIICFNRETPINTLLRIISYRLSIPILFMEGGILPGTIEFDSVGNDALSWPVRNNNQFNQLEISKEDRNRAVQFISFLKKNKISRKAQRSGGAGNIIKKTKDSRPLIFFAGSNERGTGIYMKTGKDFKEYSPFFSGNRDAVTALLELAEKYDWYVIFKPHPNETDYKKNYNIKNPRLITERHANVFSLIEISDVTITITSGISGISLIHGKPSILLGKNGLFGKGATYDLDKIENLGNLIQNALEYGLTKEMQEKWLEYAARTIKYYSFSFGTDIEDYIGRGIDESAQLLVDFLDEKKRSAMFV